MSRSHNDERFPDDLQEVADALRDERPALSPLELDRVKLRAMSSARHSTSPRKGSFMRSRLTTVLAAAFLALGTGGALALSDGGGSSGGSASFHEYRCAPHDRGCKDHEREERERERKKHKEREEREHKEKEERRQKERERREREHKEKEERQKKEHERKEREHKEREERQKKEHERRERERKEKEERERKEHEKHKGH
jgi:flagellar biosynthesis GTPase FlhF